MDELIQRVRDSGTDDTPRAFQMVAETISHAGDKYSLEWTDDLRRFPYSFVGEGNSSSESLQVVLAYFDSGETIACFFKSNGSVNLCALTK